MQKEEKIVRGADLTTTGQRIKSYVLGLLADKEDKLISGENIKTINGSSILGAGDVAVVNDADVPISLLVFQNQRGWPGASSAIVPALITNAKTIGTEAILKTSDFVDSDNKLTFVDTNSGGNVVWYAVALMNENKMQVSRLGYQSSPEFTIDPATYPYFSFSLGLHQGSSDIGGDQADYGLENVYIKSQKIPDKSNATIYAPSVRGELFKDTAFPLTAFDVSFVKMPFTLNWGYGDCTCYNGLVFEFHGTNDYVWVWDIETGELVQKIGPLDEYNLKYHNNSVSFGTQKYNASDEFPVIYASQEDEEVNLCVVYRVTGTRGNYALTKVQTINYPTINSGNGKGIYFPNCYIDGANNRLVLGGLMNGGWTWYNAATNRVRYSTFELPSPTAGDVTLSYSNILSQSPIFSKLPTPQGAFCRNGMLYQVFGMPANALYLAIDLNTWMVKESCDLSKECVALEPEGCFEHDNHIYINFNGGDLYRMDRVRMSMDVTPKKGSLNPVTSAGIYEKLAFIEAKDLSTYDVTGLSSILRNTANCYVVRATGSYRFPLVYGNGIKNSTVNSAAYTNGGGTYQAAFVNHKGNNITSPYIEENTGCSVTSVGLLWQTTAGAITTVDLMEGSDCRYIHFNVAQVPAINAMAVLYAKDANDEIVWSWAIWLTPDDLTPSVFTNYTGATYKLMPQPLGTIWNAARTKATAAFYQWGRKDPMPPAAAYWSPNFMNLYDIDGNAYSGYGNFGTAEDQSADKTVANAIKLPNKFFTDYESVAKNWNNLTWFNNFWNAAQNVQDNNADDQATAVKTIYDPSPAGFMLPGGRAFTGFTTTGGNTTTAAQFNIIGSFSNGFTFKRNADDAVGQYFIAAGQIDKATGNIASIGNAGNYWTYASGSQTGAKLLYYYSGGIYPAAAQVRGNANSVLPCKEV